MRATVWLFLCCGLWAQSAQPAPTSTDPTPAPAHASASTTPATAPAPASTTPAPITTSTPAVAALSPCLIVKHKGTVGRRLIWTALIGVPIAPGSKYDYVDSVNYKNTKMSYKGKEIEALQKDGVHVSVLNKNYTPPELDSARQACQSVSPTAEKK